MGSFDVSLLTVTKFWGRCFVSAARRENDLWGRRVIHP